MFRAPAVLALQLLLVLGCSGSTRTAPPPTIIGSQPIAVAASTTATQSTPAALPASPLPVAAPAMAPTVAPTPTPSWTEIYATYFAPGTAGSCARAGKCHRDVMADAASAYTWLAQRGYVAGAHSALVSRTNSCLRWFGGNMPPRGAPNEDAVRDLEAWVAAGAPAN